MHACNGGKLYTEHSQAKDGDCYVYREVYEKLLGKRRRLYGAAVKEKSRLLHGREHKCKIVLRLTEYDPRANAQ